MMDCTTHKLIDVGDAFIVSPIHSIGRWRYLGDLDIDLCLHRRVVIVARMTSSRHFFSTAPNELKWPDFEHDWRDMVKLIYKLINNVVVNQSMGSMMCTKLTCNFVLVIFRIPSWPFKAIDSWNWHLTCALLSIAIDFYDRKFWECSAQFKWNEYCIRI